MGDTRMRVFFARPGTTAAQASDLCRQLMPVIAARTQVWAVLRRRESGLRFQAR